MSCNNNNIHFFDHLFLFGNGVSSISVVLVDLFLQFPRTGSKAADPCTLNDIVLWQNCWTVGLSFLPPAALCLPKNDSNGSWHNFSDRKNSTPGADSNRVVISIKEETR